MNGHRDLPAWRQCHAVALAVYRATDRLPESERYGLRTQLRRAAASVSANVAEGYGRFGAAEFARGISIAMGSLAEVDALLALARDLGYIDDDAFREIDGLRDATGASLYALHRHLRGRRGRASPRTG
jgi:four helix bundle protein